MSHQSISDLLFLWRPRFQVERSSFEEPPQRITSSSSSSTVSNITPPIRTPPPSPTTGSFIHAAIVCNAIQTDYDIERMERAERIERDRIRGSGGGINVNTPTSPHPISPNRGPSTPNMNIPERGSRVQLRCSNEAPKSWTKGQMLGNRTLYLRGFVC